MRKLVIVTSTICPRNGALTYSQSKTHFSSDERLRQTIFTVNSLTNSLPDADIVIVDTSDEYQQYAALFHSYFKNVNFVPLKQLSSDACEIVNTNTHKSHCESLLLQTYYEKFKDDIKNNYDFIFKTSGRYFHFDFNDKLLTEENKDKIFFKKPIEYTWSDSWRYHFVDLRHVEQTNVLRQYSTVLYGYGVEHLDKFMDMNVATIHLTKYASMSHYDIETLYYYFTRQYKNSIIEVDWKVSGWLGPSGQFVYY